MTDSGFLVYILVMGVLFITLCVIASVYSRRKQNCLRDTRLAQLNAASAVRFAAIDEDGRGIPPDDLIRAYRRSVLVNGWSWVVVGSINFVLGAWLWIAATQWFDADHVAGVRALALFNGVPSGIWLLAGLFALRHHRWAIWLGVLFTISFGAIAFISILIAFKAAGRGFALAYVMLIFPACQFGQNTYRMGPRWHSAADP